MAWNNDKSIAVMLFILNIVLLPFVIIILQKIYHEMPVDKIGTQTCVPCTTIPLHPDDVPSGVTIDSKNSSKCCFDDKAKIGTLLNYLVDNWSRKVWSKDHHCAVEKWASGKVEDRPKIKLVAYTYRSPGKDSIVKWNSKHEMSFSHKFRYQDGYIRVDVTGFYHIYSLVTVRVKGDLQPSVSHALILQKAMEEDGKETVLAKSDDKPKCLIDHAKASDHGIMYPSRIDIVVPLTKGDRFHVKLINVVEIMTDPTKTFIGAYMLSV